MTLEDFYFVSQIAAALGIMASLIFVGLQVRQSTRQAKSDAVQAVHDNFAEWYMAVASTPFKAEGGVKGLRGGLSALSEAENMNFVTDVMAVTSYLQSAYFKWRDGDLPDELWHSWEKSSLSYLDTTGGKEFWEIRKYIFAPDFVEYVEANLLNRGLPEGARPWVSMGSNAAGKNASADASPAEAAGPKAREQDSKP